MAPYSKVDELSAQIEQIRAGGREPSTAMQAAYDKAVELKTRTDAAAANLKASREEREAKDTAAKEAQQAAHQARVEAQATVVEQRLKSRARGPYLAQGHSDAEFELAWPAIHQAMSVEKTVATVRQERPQVRF